METGEIVIIGEAASLLRGTLIEEIKSYRREGAGFMERHVRDGWNCFRLTGVGFIVDFMIDADVGGKALFSVRSSLLNDKKCIDILLDVAMMLSRKGIRLEVSNSSEFHFISNHDDVEINKARGFIERLFNDFKSAYTEQTVGCAPDETLAELEALGFESGEMLSEEEWNEMPESRM